MPSLVSFNLNLTAAGSELRLSVSTGAFRQISDYSRLGALNPLLDQMCRKQGTRLAKSNLAGFMGGVQVICFGINGNSA